MAIKVTPNYLNWQLITLTVVHGTNGSEKAGMSVGGAAARFGCGVDEVREAAVASWIGTKLMSIDDGTVRAVLRVDLDTSAVLGVCQS